MGDCIYRNNHFNESTTMTFTQVLAALEIARQNKEDIKFTHPDWNKNKGIYISKGGIHMCDADTPQPIEPEDVGQFVDMTPEFEPTEGSLTQWVKAELLPRYEPDNKPLAGNDWAKSFMGRNNIRR